MAKARVAVATQLGRRHGRPDIDRVGYFDDVPNASRDQYSRPGPIREDVLKGRQMYPGPTVELFQKEFKRIFVGEALPELGKPISPPGHKKEKDPKSRPPLLPPSPTKIHSGPGDSYGCFEKPTAFSPLLKPEAARRRQKGDKYTEPRNFTTKPGKLGGPGVADICINPYPSYTYEPYEPVESRKDKGKRARGKVDKPKRSFVSMSGPLEYFTPNPYYEPRPGPTYVRPKMIPVKIIGTGRLYVPFPKSLDVHDGTFGKFPPFSSEPYEPVIKRTKLLGPPWVGGGPDLRMKYTDSIVNRITAISCNANNYREYRERVYPLPE